jgi:hypothetical protein
VRVDGLPDVLGKGTNGARWDMSRSIWLVLCQIAVVPLVSIWADLGPMLIMTLLSIIYLSSYLAPLRAPLRLELLPLPSRLTLDLLAYTSAAMSPPLSPAQSLPDTTTPETVTPTICDSCSMELEKEMPSTLTPSANPKDVRAYEHDRQRVKKAAERVLTKARKERWSMCKGAVYDKTKCSCQSDKGKRLESKDVKVLVDGDVLQNVPGAFPKTGRPRRSDSFGPLPFKGPRDVKLADLVTAGKPKKSKGTCPSSQIFLFHGTQETTEGDFEVVPHIRSVIVLDDFSGDEKDVEEPWEHIQLGDDFDEKLINGPSYAEVVAFTK